MLTGTLISIDLLTMVNACYLWRSEFKAFVNFHWEILFTIYYLKTSKNRLIRKKQIFVFLILFLSPIISEASAHSMFNSAESFIGNNRVQIATLPEIPVTGEPMQILFRVTDVDFEEVDRFTMGIRIFYDDIQLDAIRPQK